MKWRRVSAVAKKEFLHVFRDPRSLGMGIVIPMVLLLLFGYALSLDVDRVPLVVWDQSQSHTSRELIARFSGSRYFQVVKQVRNYRALVEEIDHGRALAALIIPGKFAHWIDSGREAPVQLIIDGSDANTATLALGYADGVTFDFSRDRAIAEIGQRLGQRLRIPIDARSRVWFNADMQSRNYIVPGLIPVIMMVIAALLTSLTIAREWERGTMEQLISTPVKGPELIVGKLIPYFVIGMLDVTLAVIMGKYLFAVPLRGNLVLLFGMAAIFLVGVLSLGILISVATKSQLLSSQVAMLVTFLPSFLLSGFMFAISNMPKVIQWITHLVPARYLVTLLKAIYLKGVGLEVLYLEAGLLSLFSAVMLTLAIVKFKKKLM